MEEEKTQKDQIVRFAKENREIAAVQFICDDPEGIQVQHIDGGGLVNYVFLVKSKNNKASIVLKYGEETMRCLPEEKVPVQRQELEYNCLCLMHSIQPGSAPQPFHHDKKHNILAMEDMSDWELLGSQLERRHVDLGAATNLGQILGRMHSKTSKDNVSAEQWEELQGKFGQAELKDDMRKLAFERGLVQTDPINKIPESVLESYQKYVKDIKQCGIYEKLSKLFNMQICLIHGDCHDKSIFIKNGCTALFDFEFAFLGHPVYDLAFSIVGYIRTCIMDKAHTTTEQTLQGLSTDEFRTSCLQAIKRIVEAYVKVGTELSNCDDTSRMPLMSELVSFTGNLMFSISIFAQLDKILPLVDDSDRGQMLDVGFKLLKAHEKVKTVDQFMEVLCHAI